jgi:exopolysaccharide biosynthesis WecB/TagA/CpsF family protein
MVHAAGPAPDRLVNALIDLEETLAASGRPVRVTWLNHYSVGLALDVAPDAVKAMDVCGIDGQLLKWLVRHPYRTSADLVVPRLLERDEAIRTVLAIGGRGDRSEPLRHALTRMAGRPITVHSVDGFEGLRRGSQLRRLVTRVRPDLVLVGLGAGLQEQVLLEVAEAMPRGYALTCGGFLDQVLHPAYYPSWAYPLRLNWLVRLAREPRRLWRRYSVDAVGALARRSEWLRSTSAAPGVSQHAALCAYDGAGPGLPAGADSQAA